MTNKKLEAVLKQIDINECQEIVPNHIYHIIKTVRTRYYRNMKPRYDIYDYEFLVIAPNGVKKAIILRCGSVDLHWLVLKKWRGQHVLSDALRTGVINELWPKNKTITCSYSWNGEDEDDEYEDKLAKTHHLADIANLEVVKSYH